MYKGILYGIFLVTILAFASCKETITINRTQTDLDEWLFRLDDQKGADSINFDDKSWQKIKVPHDWGIQNTYSQINQDRWNNGALHAGIGWYRIHFKNNPSWNYQFVDLVLDGIGGEYIDIWINGHKLENKNLFRHRISSYLKPNNVISIRVDRDKKQEEGIYSGVGLNREVFIESYNAVHFIPESINISTSIYSDLLNQFNFTCDIINEDSLYEREVEIKYILIDKDGNEVITSNDEIKIKSGEKQQSSVQVEIETPHFWTPEDPYLYRLLSEIYVDGDLLDKKEKKIGIKISNSTPKKGANVFEQSNIFGTELSSKIWIYKLKSLKLLGYNAVSTLGKNFSSDFYEICDSLGLIVQTKPFYVQAFDYLSSANWPLRTDTLGLIDLCGLPKRDFVQKDTAGRAAQIKLSFIDKPKSVDDGLVFIKAEVTDKYGVTIPKDTSEITFQALGAVRIVGVENADPRDITAYNSRKRRLYKGKCVVALKFTGVPEKLPMTLTALSTGIIEGHIKIEIK